MKTVKRGSMVLVFLLLALYASLLLSGTAYASSILTVGPGGMYATPAEAYAAAAPGDIIEIDAAGTYYGNAAMVAISGKDNVTFRGVNGRPHMEADPSLRLTWGKALWVIAANNITVDNIEFSGATIKRDKNGAGIRIDPWDHPTILNCYFHNCDDGILMGEKLTSNVTVENCEFAYCGYGDGYSHSIYIGKVNNFTFRYNYSHHAKNGHLLKSRAANNYIEYNRLTDDSADRTWYSTRNIDVCNGGLTYIIGNIMQQGTYAANRGMVGYALEYNDYTGKNCYVINNTIVNDNANQAYFLEGRNDTTITIIYKNNIFTGTGVVQTGSCNWTASNNYTGDPSYVNRSALDYHLTSASTQVIDQGINPGSGDGYALLPSKEYSHPCSYTTRTVNGSAVDIGAFEY